MRALIKSDRELLLLCIPCLDAAQPEPPAGKSDGAKEPVARSKCAACAAAMPGHAGGAARRLTEEQQAIVDLAMAPRDVPPEGVVVRVTSAAGTGKTTTVEALARRLGELGHRKVLYLTFNKAAAVEAQGRLGGYAICKTLHAQALACLRFSLKALSDTKIDELSMNMFAEDFAKLMASQPRDKRVSEHKAAFYVRKTLQRYCHSADKDFGQHHTCYQAVIQHGSSCRKVYSELAKRLFERLRPSADQAGSTVETNFDVLMKECQLRNLRSDATAVLVDEAQDCCGCQLAWVEAHRPGRMVVFVGDAAQTIYSFRGANPAELLKVRGCIDRTLTRSFRFGPHIATVANTLLFVKQLAQPAVWRPYRVVGAAPYAGQVFPASRLWTPGMPPVTVLAHRNVTLLEAAIECLNARGQQQAPRFALHASGGSAVKAWFHRLSLVRKCFKLFTGEASQLDVPQLRQVRNLTWERFLEILPDYEVDGLDFAARLINKNGERTLHMITLFADCVLKKSSPPHEADLILSTIHAAKGMEWDSVWVCEDLVSLARYAVSSPSAAPCFASAQEVFSLMQAATADGDEKGPNVGFAVPAQGDSLNMWYVALTRARHVLYVPQLFQDLMASFVEIEAHAASGEAQQVILAPFTEDEAASIQPAQVFNGPAIRSLARDLVQPWKREVLASSPHYSPIGLAMVVDELEEEEEEMNGDAVKLEDDAANNRSAVKLEHESLAQRSRSAVKCERVSEHFDVPMPHRCNRNGVKLEELSDEEEGVTEQLLSPN